MILANVYIIVSTRLRQSSPGGRQRKCIAKCIAKKHRKHERKEEDDGKG
jgi:hypothetical protein